MKIHERIKQSKRRLEILKTNTTPAGKRALENAIARLQSQQDEFQEQINALEARKALFQKKINKAETLYEKECEHLAKLTKIKNNGDLQRIAELQKYLEEHNHLLKDRGTDDEN